MAGGSGFMQGMIDSLKYNRSQLKKKRVFDVLKAYSKKSIEYDRQIEHASEKLDPEQLEHIKTDIRKRIERRRKRRTIISVFITSLLAIALILLLVSYLV